ncbi:MAG TPA: amine oxidase, partial [Gammaproteobacteria bacterium]|nr:amine oxidase [Gammaproteobacteria bacterium]
GKLFPATDISLAELLQQQRQTDRLIQAFWQPLCLAIMNTPIQEASATIFIQVLSDAFLKQRRDADLLFPHHDLGALFPEPAMQYIEQQGGHVHLGMRVSALSIENGEIRGVHIDNTFVPAQQLLLATSVRATLALIQEQKALAPLHAKLAQFHFQPVTTIYLQYPPEVHLTQPMQGLIDGCAQWIFDRRHCGQPGMISVVISARGPHMDEPKDHLGKRVAAELARLFPHWPAARAQFVIREKRATFSSSVNINRLRPENRTSVKGLWLAGDYTNNGYPATLEGAVRSGVQCAALIDDETR